MKRATALLLLIASVTPSVAHADAATDAEVAQTLFEEARALVQNGDYARACPMFAESERLDPGGGTLLNLGVCHENEGKLAAAWQELNDALSQALKDGRRDREQTAREHIRSILPRLPKLLLVPPSRAVDGLAVEIDGVSIGRAALGVGTPLDPGTHRVRAAAPGRVAWEWNGALVEGERRSLTIPDLVATAPEPPREPDAKKSFSAASYVMGGVAVAALATAGVTGLIALGRQSDYERLCVPDRSYCPDASGRDAAQSARTFAWISTGALVAGVGAAIVAIVLPRRLIPRAVTARGLAFEF